MSNFDSNRKAKEERKEKDKLSRENLGKFFYDLAKLVFEIGRASCRERVYVLV